MSTKPTKKKSPVKRDEDFEELDNELEAALQALASINERTATLLQRVEQGTELIPDEAVAPAADGDAADAPGKAARPETDESTENADDDSESAEPTAGA